jgi:hypothetical protein
VGVKRAEKILCQAAQEFCATGKVEQLTKAAFSYGKAKMKAANNRDKWKAKKRLQEG